MQNSDGMYAFQFEKWSCGTNFKQFDGSSANDDIDSRDEGQEGAKYAALFGLLATNTCCSALE